MTRSIFSTLKSIVIIFPILVGAADIVYAFPDPVIRFAAVTDEGNLRVHAEPDVVTETIRHATVGDDEGVAFV